MASIGTHQTLSDKLSGKLVQGWLRNSSIPLSVLFGCLEILYMLCWQFTGNGTWSLEGKRKARRCTFQCRYRTDIKVATCFLLSEVHFPCHLLLHFKGNMYNSSLISDTKIMSINRFLWVFWGFLFHFYMWTCFRVLLKLNWRRSAAGWASCPSSFSHVTSSGVWAHCAIELCALVLLRCKSDFTGCCWLSQCRAKAVFWRCPEWHNLIQTVLLRAADTPVHTGHCG